MASSITKHLFFSLIFVLCLFEAFAQTDTEFWFAVPEVSTGSSLFDRAIYIRISTLQQASEVRISQPANSNFAPILVNIAANTTQTIDLTNYIDIIENKPANTVLNYGLLIAASNPVSAYYEVASTNCNCNPEIFSLKGKNALGTLFYTPFQNLWDNSHLVNYSPTPYSSFDIIATENGTSVTITPKNGLVGHIAGTSFTIILNKGQTYSATALSQFANKHLDGSKIIADKPIAVTIKDDLLYVPGQNSSMLGIDLIGDQIVPVNIIGNEYILPKGRLFTNEKAFILATQDATAIYIDGNTLPIATINTGTTFTLNISNPNTYIKTNNPVYVLHTSGYEYELGAALLPKLECNGSRQVGFTRSNSQVFALSLVVRKGGEAGFVLNGNANIISPTNFSVVAGTGGEWMSAQILFNTATIPINVASLLSNSISVFQMGIVDGNDGGASYSYSSDFNNPTVYLGSDKSICSGGFIILDAGPNKSAYTWNDGSNNQTLQVSKGGKYWVTTSIGSCISSDTIIIMEESLPSVDLGSDKIICTGQSIVLDVTHAGATYKWQDGSTNSSFEVKSAGTYWVEVSNKCGTVRDEIIVIEKALPSINLGNDIILCKQQSITLDASNAGATYKWQNGSTLSTFTADKAGVYWVEVSNSCGIVRDEITITEMALPFVNLGGDKILCTGQNIVLNAANPGATYKWQDGSISPTFDVKIGGTYWVEVSNKCGTVRDEITVTEQFLPSVNLGSDTVLCMGQTLQLNVTKPNTTYKWQDGSTNSTFTVNKPGIYWVEVAAGSCTSIDSILVAYTTIPTRSLGKDTTLCAGQTLKLVSNLAAVIHHWQDGSTEDYFLVTTPGTYWIEITHPCGTQRDSITIAYQEVPTLFLGKDTIICEGQSLILHTKSPGASFVWQNNSTDSIFSVKETGLYWVEASFNNCRVRDSIYIEFQECLENIYIPNVITPNGDDKNETFFIKGVKPGTWYITIYNRWGKPVYQSHEYLNDWDGQNLSTGLYFYYLSNPYNGRKYKGWVHLLR